jgi:hypothetical protein
MNIFFISLFYSGRVATARTQPALALAIFIGKQYIVAPTGGTLSKLASFSN